MLVRNQLFAWIRKRTQSPAMPPQLTVWDRFKGAVSTTIYHEACVVGAVACLALISVTEPNPTAFYTVTVLWLMRWSAKLNLFFGVRAFNERWLPDHLNYLVSYLRTDRLSAFLPISTAIGFFCDLPDF